MDSPLKLILLIAVLFIVSTIWFLIIKYFYLPLFFKSTLKSSDTFVFLESKNLAYIDHRRLNKREKILNPFDSKNRNSLNKLYFMRSEYLLTGYSKSKNKHLFFWVELDKSYLNIFNIFRVNKRSVLNFKEITDIKTLTELRKNNQVEYVIIADKCPACNNSVSNKTTKCPNCGLNLDA